VIENYKYIGNLEKGTYYEVRVVAFDGFRRDFSDVQTVDTDGFGMLFSIVDGTVTWLHLITLLVIESFGNYWFNWGLKDKHFKAIFLVILISENNVI